MIGFNWNITMTDKKTGLLSRILFKNAILLMRHYYLTLTTSTFDKLQNAFGLVIIRLSDKFLPVRR